MRHMDYIVMECQSGKHKLRPIKNYYIFNNIYVFLFF